MRKLFQSSPLDSFLRQTYIFKRLNLTLFLQIFSVCFCILLMGCGMEDEVDQEGYWMLQVDTDFTITTETKSSTESRASVPSVNDFVVELYNASGSTLVQKWEHFSDMGETIRSKTGDFLLKTYYGEQHTGAFEKPYYEGSSSFSVKGKQTTQVAVTARIANTKVSVNYKEGFKNYFKDYSMKMASTGDSLLFSKNETRAAFFEPGKVGMSLALTKQDGTQLSYSPASISTEKGKHYIINIDVSENGSGGMDLVIAFDKSTENRPITITLPGSATAVKSPPFILPTGFANGRILSFIVGATDIEPVSALVIAEGGISSCKISTDSYDVMKMNWPIGAIDLAATDASSVTNQQIIRDLGFDFTPSMNGLQMAELDFTKLIPLLPTNSQVDLTHTFYIEVTDEEGDTNARFSVVLQSMNPGFRLFKPVDIPTGSTLANIRFELSEGSINQIKAEYLSYGVWSACEFEKPIEKTNIVNIYSCTIKIPALTTQGQSIRLNYNNGARYSNEQVIEYLK